MMHRLSFLLFLLLFTFPVFSQRHILVSPEDEIVVLKTGDDPLRIIEQRSRPAETRTCDSQFWMGYPPPSGPPPNAIMNAGHGDIVGEWFVAKATGTIDTIYWRSWAAGSAADSSVLLRVHRSFIGPDYGPGIRPGPYDPPCQQWGYWVDTHNSDGGIAAFPEWATDTTWHSTIRGSQPPTTPPIGDILWGSTGFPVKVEPYGTNVTAMDALTGPIAITAGDKFFISLEVPRGCHPDCPPGGGDEVPTSFEIIRWVVQPTDEDYPSRLWKYYQHDQGTSCGSSPADSVSRGWIARGSLPGEDSTKVMMLAIWYSMTATDNVPPYIVDNPWDYPQLHSTFSTAPRQLSMIIEDCNPAIPENAGVVGAYLRYSVDGSPQPDIPLIDAGADIWTATIPGQPPGSSVTYQPVAWDIDGDTGASAPISYTVVPFGTEWYSIDTGYACAPLDISSTGTDLLTSDFFLPPWAPSEAIATDDGTSGPHDMGSSFILFGKPFRYAWIGVNGGIALTESPTDTQDVNANGEWSPVPWNIPGMQKQGRGTGFSGGGMPAMYIAPLAADHIVADSNGIYGRILHGNGGDSCRFIVQWDSVGGLTGFANPFPAPGPDITTFRAILNRCTGSVEFQYESVGTTGYDSANHSGMQADTSVISSPQPGYVTLNNLGYPVETRPRDGSCVRFFPAVGMVVDAGWNLVSVPMTPHDSDFTPSTLFPEVNARWYAHPYSASLPAELSPGTGYWVKTGEVGKIGRLPGSLLHNLNAPVIGGWNMIGGPSDIIPVGSIDTSGTAILSPFYGYGASGYTAATDIEPGKGYWVKVSGDGTLGMRASEAAPAKGPAGAIEVPASNEVTVTDATGRSQTLYLTGASRVKSSAEYFELPPSPPPGAYDVRFASGNWLEIYPEDAGVGHEYPVTIGGAAYPVTVRWEIRHPVGGGRSFQLGGPATGARIEMEGSGHAVFDDPSVKTVTIHLREGAGIPAGFSLSHNYPNPFNPGTSIGFSIGRSGFVSLKVFNTIGEEVATLIDETLPSGNHTAEWTPAGLPSGVYFCRLSVGEFRQTRKLVLMR